MLGPEAREQPGQVTGLRKRPLQLHSLVTCNPETNEGRIASQATSGLHDALCLFLVHVDFSDNLDDESLEGLFRLRFPSPTPGESDVRGLVGETYDLSPNKERGGG